MSAERVTKRGAEAMLAQLAADRKESSYWTDKWLTTQGDQHIEAWLESLRDFLPPRQEPSVSTGKITLKITKGEDGLLRLRTKGDASLFDSLALLEFATMRIKYLVAQDFHVGTGEKAAAERLATGATS